MKYIDLAAVTFKHYPELPHVAEAVANYLRAGLETPDSDVGIFIISSNVSDDPDLCGIVFRVISEHGFPLSVYLEPWFGRSVIRETRFVSETGELNEEEKKLATDSVYFFDSVNRYG